MSYKNNKYRVTADTHRGYFRMDFRDYNEALSKYREFVSDQLDESYLVIEVVMATRHADGSDTWLPIFRSRNDHPAGEVLADADKNHPSWSDCVQGIIEEKDMSISDLARLVDMSPSNFHNLLSHGRNGAHNGRLPKLGTLCEIASALGYHLEFVPDEAGTARAFSDNEADSRNHYNKKGGR